MIEVKFYLCYSLNVYSFLSLYAILYFLLSPFLSYFCISLCIYCMCVLRLLKYLSLKIFFRDFIHKMASELFSKTDRHD